MNSVHPSAYPDEFFYQLELKRTRALVERNLPLLELLHAPEYELITPAGKVFSRDQYLDRVAAEPFYAGWEVGAVRARASDQMALIRYKAKLAFPSGRVVQCWHTDSYELRNGNWQDAWSQATELPAEQNAAQPRSVA